jgi:hypothetical protein
MLNYYKKKIFFLFKKYLNREPNINELNKYYNFIIKYGEKNTINKVKKLMKTINYEKIVYDLYQIYLKRIPDKKGLIFYKKKIKEKGTDYLIEKLKNCEEYKKLYENSNNKEKISNCNNQIEQYINNLYLKHLYRKADDIGLQNYVKLYKLQGKKFIEEDIKKSEEYLNLKKYKFYLNNESNNNLFKKEEYLFNSVKDKILLNFSKKDNKIFIYYCENINDINIKLINKLKKKFNVLIYYKNGKDLKDDNIISIKLNFNLVYSIIINLNELKSFGNLFFITNNYYLKISNNIILNIDNLNKLINCFKNNNYDILSPIIKSNNMLVYYGGILNKSNEIYYFNSNELDINNGELNYTKSTLIYFKDLYISKINNLLNLKDDKNLYVNLSNKKIKVNPFILSYVKKNIYNYNYINFFNFEYDSLKQYFKINNEKFLYSMKYDKYKTFSLNNNKNILILEHSIITPDKDCGSKFIKNFIDTLLKLDYNIFYFQDNFSQNWEYINILREKGVYVNTYNHNSKDNKLENLLKYNYNLFDYIFVSRFDKMEYYYNILRKYNSRSKLIFQTHDLNFLRIKRSKNYSNIIDNKKIAFNIKDENSEIDLIRNCEMSILVSEFEYNYLKLEKKINDNKLFNLPIMFEDKEAKKYNARKRDGFLFIGSNHTPNVDAVDNFIKNYFSYIVEYNNNIKFHLIGSCCNYINKSLVSRFNKNIILHNFLSDSDMKKIFETCRLSIVPLRYGAGMKGKILDSFNYNLPVITCNIGVEGIDVTNGENIILIENNKEYPKFFIKYYNDFDLLNKVSENGSKLFKSKYSVSNQINYVKRLMKKIDNSPLKKKNFKSTICLIYTTYYENNTNDLLALFREANNNFDYDMICVKNNRNMKIIQNDKCIVIEGTNKIFEFSAYNEAINYIFEKDKIHNYSHFIILNDTFLKNHPLNSLVNLNYDLIEEMFSDHNCVYGNVDYYSNKKLKLDNFEFQNWIRSNFIVIPQSKLKFLKDKVLRYTIENTFNEDQTLKFNCDQIILDFIDKWLKNDRYSKFKKDNKLLIKICTIFNEYNLTNLFRKNNVKIKNIKNIF